MKYAIRFGLCLAAVVLVSSVVLAGENAFVAILKNQLETNGFQPAAALYRNPDEKLAPIGRVIFQSKGLSLNGEISCQTCHLKDLGSGDGIPLAAAIGGKGEGAARLMSGAELLSRNTLPLWGRGENGFDTFFWDGRVDFSDNKKFSQFGAHPPSDDALVTAAHLPVVQIREMLDEDAFVEKHKHESVADAQEVYSAIAANLGRVEVSATHELATALDKPVDRLGYTDYARSIAAFIRSEFGIQPTKLERFMNGNENLTEDELRGGILFFGKGHCTTCHSGPYFSEVRFHEVVFPR